MAIAFTSYDNEQVSGSGSTFTSSSITPPSSQDVYAYVGWDVFTATPGTISTLAGNGLTWSYVDGIDDTSGTGRCELWKANGTASSGTLVATITGNGSGLDKACFMVVSATGADTSASIVQHVPGAARLDGTPTPFTITLSALADAANNAVLAFFNVYNTGSAWSGNGTYTVLNSTDVTYPYLDMYKVPGTTTPTINKGAFDYIRGIAIEVKAAGAGGSGISLAWIKA